MNPRIALIIFVGILVTAFLVFINFSIGLERFWEILSPRGLFIRFDRPLATPSATLTQVSGSTKTFTGEYVTFSYPGKWNIEKITPVDGAMNELITLGIPGVTSDQQLGFYTKNLEQTRPSDIAQEEKITIAGRSGYKWLRKGNNYVSYDYYAPGFADIGTFGVHVTVVNENKILEQQLDQIAKTVSY